MLITLHPISNHLLLVLWVLLALVLAGVFHVFLGLETVLVGGVSHRVDDAIRGCVAVSTRDLDGFVVFGDLLEGTLLLAGRAVAGFEPGGWK